MYKRKRICFLAFIMVCVLISIIILNILEKKEIKNIQATLKKQSSPKYVFYFIGDGMGANQGKIGELFKQYIEKDDNTKLVFNSFPVTGMVSTLNSDSLVTDSAAAGTALATGKKTKNRFVSVGPDGKTSYRTLLEAAQEKGMATGLISTVPVVDATAAAFAAHTKNRFEMDEIAVQYLNKNIDYIAGGGRESFIPEAEEGSTRKDDRNLLKEFKNKGYTIVKNKEELLDVNTNDVDKVLALFSLSHMPFEIDKRYDKSINTPSLAEMVKSGINVLYKNKKGFFMVIEEGEIDYAAHTDDLPALAYQVLELDKAVKVAYDFYKEHPDETLIIVVADHEIGGLTLGVDKRRPMNLETVEDVSASIYDDIYPKYQENTKDIKGLLAYIEDKYSIKLSKEERSHLERELKRISQEKFERKCKEREAFGRIIGQITAERINAGWTSTWHTAADVPITAIGMDSQLFCGYMDNTDVAKKVAKAVGLSLE